MAMIKVEVPDGDKCKDCPLWIPNHPWAFRYICPHRTRDVAARLMAKSRKTKACKEAHVEVTE